MEMILNIISKIGYVICSLVFLYMMFGLTLEVLKTRNKWLGVSILLMAAVVAITLSEVF